jgi:large subunit ribosomal protein L9
MIEVILLERIERLGQMGQVVKVRPGFARNFLLPRSKALRATKSNLELFEKQRSDLEAKNAAERGKAQTFAAKLDGLKFVIVRQASETGQLYGSVSARDVSDAAKESGHDLPRALIQIDEPIKTIGLFNVKVKLHPEVLIKVTVNIARSADEASIQDEKNKAEVKAASEKAAVEAAFHAPASDEPVADKDEAEVVPKKAKKTKKAAEADDSAEDVKEKAEPKAKKTKAKKAAAD